MGVYQRPATSDEIYHSLFGSNKGKDWKNHKYIKKVDNRYFYDIGQLKAYLNGKMGGAKKAVTNTVNNVKNTGAKTFSNVKKSSLKTVSDIKKDVSAMRKAIPVAAKTIAKNKKVSDAYKAYKKAYDSNKNSKTKGSFEKISPVSKTASSKPQKNGPMRPADNKVKRQGFNYESNALKNVQSALTYTKNVTNESAKEYHNEATAWAEEAERLYAMYASAQATENAMGAGTAGAAALYQQYATALANYEAYECCAVGMDVLFKNDDETKSYAKDYYKNEYSDDKYETIKELRDETRKNIRDEFTGKEAEVKAEIREARKRKGRVRMSNVSSGTNI